MDEDALERLQAMTDNIMFSERTLPKEPFQTVGFTMYVVFLVVFCVVTIGRQGEAPFLLAKFARDQIGHDEFMKIDNTIAYTEWLECESSHRGSGERALLRRRPLRQTTSFTAWATSRESSN